MRDIRTTPTTTGGTEEGRRRGKEEQERSWDGGEVEKVGGEGGVEMRCERGETGEGSGGRGKECMTLTVDVIAFQFVPAAPLCRRESERERSRGRERESTREARKENEREGVRDGN